MKLLEFVIFTTSFIGVFSYYGPCEESKSQDEHLCDPSLIFHCLGKERKDPEIISCVKHEDCSCGQLCCFDFSCRMSCQDRNLTYEGQRTKNNGNGTSLNGLSKRSFPFDSEDERKSRFRREISPNPKDLPIEFWNRAHDAISRINAGQSEYVYSDLVYLSRFEPQKGSRRETKIMPYVVVVIAGLAKLRFPCIVLPALTLKGGYKPSDQSESAKFWKGLTVPVYKLATEQESLARGFWPKSLEADDQKRVDLDGVFKRYVHPSLGNVRKLIKPKVKGTRDGATTWQRLTNAVFNHITPMMYAHVPEGPLDDKMDKIVKDSPIGSESPLTKNDKARVNLTINTVNDMNKVCDKKLPDESKKRYVDTKGISASELDIWKGMSRFSRELILSPEKSRKCFNRDVLLLKTEVRFVHNMFCQWAKEFLTRRVRCKVVENVFQPGDDKTTLGVDLRDESERNCSSKILPKEPKCKDLKDTILDIYNDLSNKKVSATSKKLPEACEYYQSTIIQTFRTLQRNKSAIMPLDEMKKRLVSMGYCNWIVKDVHHDVDETFEGVKEKDMILPTDKETKDKLRFPINLDHKEKLPERADVCDQTVSDFPDQNIPGVDDLCNMALKAIVWKYHRLQDAGLYVHNVKNFNKIYREIMNIPGCDWPDPEKLKDYIREIILIFQNVPMRSLKLQCYQKLEYHMWKPYVAKLKDEEIKELSNACRWAPHAVQERVDFYHKEYRSIGGLRNTRSYDEECERTIEKIFADHEDVSVDDLTKDEVASLSDECGWSKSETQQMYNVLLEHHGMFLNGTKKTKAENLNPYLLLSSKCRKMFEILGNGEYKKLAGTHKTRLRTTCGWKQAEAENKYNMISEYSECVLKGNGNPFLYLGENCMELFQHMFIKHRTALRASEVAQLTRKCKWPSDEVPFKYSEITEAVYRSH